MSISCIVNMPSTFSSSAASSSNDLQQPKLSVATLNCWALPSIPIPFLGCRDRKLRIDSLVEAIASSSCDIITLQELWSEGDYLKLAQNSHVKEIFPFAHYFHSGLLGSGICVFSRHKIVSVLMHRYSLNGYPHHIHRGDWFGGKVVGMVKLRVEDKYHIAFYATHLHAEYDSLNDIYLSHRISQCFELTQFIRETSADVDFVVLAGDFNLEPISGGYNIITKLGGFDDAWKAVNAFECNEGMTCERPDNCFSPLHLFKTNYGGKRLDYIMFKSSKVRLTVSDCTICFNKIPGSKVNYSDHVGVVANFSVSKELPMETASVRVRHINEELDLLKDMLEVMERRNRALSCDRLLYKFGFASLLVVLIFSFTFNNFVHIESVLLKFIMDLCRFVVPFPMIFFLWYWLVGVQLEEKAIKETKYSVRKLLAATMKNVDQK